MTPTSILSLPARAVQRDYAIFGAAMAIETTHLLDDAVLNPENGATDIPSGLFALVLGVAAVAAYGRLSRWARAVLALLFGLAGLVGGLDAHVSHAIENGAGGADYSGFGHALAGLALLLLGAALALRRRDD